MRAELQRIVRRQVEQRVADLTGGGRFASIEDDVIARRIDPYSAAQAVVDVALAEVNGTQHGDPVGEPATG